MHKQKRTSRKKQIIKLQSYIISTVTININYPGLLIFKKEIFRMDFKR